LHGEPRVHPPHRRTVHAAGQEHRAVRLICEDVLYTDNAPHIGHTKVHVLRKDEGVWVRRCLDYKIKRTRPRGRSKKTWKEVVHHEQHLYVYENKNTRYVTKSTIYKNLKKYYLQSSSLPKNHYHLAHFFQPVISFLIS